MAENIAGGLAVAASSETNFRNTKLGPVIVEYLRGISTVTTESRPYILRLSENLSLGTISVVYCAENLHGAGSPRHISQQGNSLHKKELAIAIAYIRE